MDQEQHRKLLIEEYRAYLCVFSYFGCKTPEDENDALRCPVLAIAGRRRYLEVRNALRWAMRVVRDDRGAGNLPAKRDSENVTSPGLEKASNDDA